MRSSSVRRNAVGRIPGHPTNRWLHWYRIPCLLRSLFFALRKLVSLYLFMVLFSAPFSRFSAIHVHLCVGYKYLDLFESTSFRFHFTNVASFSSFSWRAVLFVFVLTNHLLVSCDRSIIVCQWEEYQRQNLQRLVKTKIDLNRQRCGCPLQVRFEEKKVHVATAPVKCHCWRPQIKRILAVTRDHPVTSVKMMQWNHRQPLIQFLVEHQPPRSTRRNYPRPSTSANYVQRYRSLHVR